MRFGLVNGLGEEEEGEDGADSSKSGLEVEYHAPGRVGYDDTADEGAECGTDQSPGQEPAHGCGALGGTVDVTQDSGANNKEGSSFESGKDTEDEK